MSTEEKTYQEITAMCDDWNRYPGTECSYLQDTESGRQWITTRKGSYEMPEEKPGEFIRFRIEGDGSVTFTVGKEQQ